MRRFLVSVAAALYFGALVGLAFVPGSDGNRPPWAWPFTAFVPVGVLLAVLLGARRWWAAIAFGVLGSAWLEAAQTIWMPDGYADMLDVVWASSGVVVGVGITVAIVAMRRKAMRSHDSHSLISQTGNREIPQD